MIPVVSEQMHHQKENDAPYRAVLFDMDGTLLDTLMDLATSGNRMLESRNFPTHPLEAYRYFVGAGARNLVTRVLPKANRDDATISSCLETFLEIYDRNWNEQTDLYPGIDEMLDSLVEKGYRLAILSNKPQDFTEMCTGKYLSRWNFEQIWGKRAEFDLKPSPESALKIAEMMKLDPAEFFYMGDTRIDMETATRAGMHPAGVLWGFRPREELLEFGAQVLVEKPDDLKTILR